MCTNASASSAMDAGATAGATWHAGWRRLAHAPVRYVVSPVAYVDNPYYYWSPYSVVNNVLVHRSIEIGPIPRVYIAR